MENIRLLIDEWNIAAKDLLFILGQKITVRSLEEIARVRSEIEKAIQDSDWILARLHAAYEINKSSPNQEIGSLLHYFKNLARASIAVLESLDKPQQKTIHIVTEQNTDPF